VLINFSLLEQLQAITEKRIKIHCEEMIIQKENPLKVMKGPNE